MRCLRYMRIDVPFLCCPQVTAAPRFVGSLCHQVPASSQGIWRSLAELSTPAVHVLGRNIGREARCSFVGCGSNFFFKKKRLRIAYERWWRLNDRSSISIRSVRLSLICVPQQVPSRGEDPPQFPFSIPSPRFRVLQLHAYVLCGVGSVDSVAIHTIHELAVAYRKVCGHVFSLLWQRRFIGSNSKRSHGGAATDDSRHAVLPLPAGRWRTCPGALNSLPARLVVITDDSTGVAHTNSAVCADTWAALP